MNIGSLLTQAALVFPERAAIVCGETQSSYTEYNGRCNRLANALASLGLRPGDHVGLLMYNCPEMLEAMFACFKAGFGAVPINFRLHPKEFAFIIDHSEARAVIVSPEFDASIAEIRGRIPKVEHIITVSPGPPGELQAYDDLLAGASEQFTDVNRSPDDIAWIFYTSGTTGLPKAAVMRNQRVIGGGAVFGRLMHEAGPGDVVYVPLPLFHTNPLCSGWGTVLVTGATMAMRRR
ncbi:MAG: AMP-binding protein, partial [Lentisphaeria bacterium]|nr:AMP-binding protein [Lentisphaeria bacterium]